jgi:hypothetical protein
MISLKGCDRTVSGVFEISWNVSCCAKKNSKQLADYSWPGRDYYCAPSECKSEATPSNQFARYKMVNDFKKGDCGASEIRVTELFFRGSKIHDEPQLMHSVT